MSDRFIHLHTHSHYSFLQALPKVPGLVKEAKKQGMDAIGLTDAGNLHGAVELYKVCAKQGLKAIIGCDFYVAPNSRLERDPSEGTNHQRTRLVLLAENNAGYQNLLKLISLSFTEGFHERPRIDRQLLKAHHEGLIAIIPSFAGTVVQSLRAGDPEGASASLAEYVSIFGKENVFIEVTHHPRVEGHEKRMQQLRELSQKEGVPLLAQHDVYYLDPDDREATEVMRRIGHGQKGNNEEEDFSFVSEASMLEWFKDIPDAVYRSGEIADRCNVTLELGSWNFPAVAVEPGKTHEQMLREKTDAGLVTRKMERTEEVNTRIEYELGVINDKGFAPYFLAVSDLLEYAKSVGILSTTRGSAAGSLVSYLVGITTVDPIAYKLPFERFLNPERPKAPDIDMDFADNRRDEMIAYAKRKYGEDHVAQIGTFGTMMARAAVRDVSRALGHAYRTGDRLAKLIPMGSQGFPMTIKHALELEPELKQLYDEDDEAREILDLAQRIEGCARHTGVHAAGVVIAPTPLTNWTPLQVDQKTGKLITQYDMHAVEDAGLLKFDFLGIKNLAIIADAVERVSRGRHIEIDIENIPMDDEATFQMLARGDTEGTFQLNGSGMTRYLKELRPTTIHDINAMVALYRPGPMETIPQYIERKRNARLITYLDERMKDYLDASYGLLVYQDDVLLTAITLGGYSWLEADTLRKAMGKKIPAEMEAQKEKLLKGFREFGKLSDAKGIEIWELIEPFAAYGFNKCLTADTRVTDAATGVTTSITRLIQNKSPLTVHALNSRLKLRTAKASKPFENGVKLVFKLTTRSGRTIRATGNHPFRTFAGFTHLELLRKGMRIAVARRVPQPRICVPITYQEAAAIGYLIAEGNLCHPHGVCFYSTKDDEVQDFIKSALFFKNTKITIDTSKSTKSVYVGQINQKVGNQLKKWLTLHGLSNRKATEKQVPAILFSTDDSTLAVFLAKLWQGDGSVSVANSQTFYATSSHTLAQDVQHLLLRFGIVSTIYTKKFNYRGTHKVGWTVVVTGLANLLQFKDRIGIHMLSEKKMALGTLCTQSARRTNTLGRGTTDTIPMDILPLILDEIKKYPGTIKQFAKRAGVSERLLGRDAKKRGLTRESLLTIATALDSKILTDYATSDIFWDEVVSVLPDGKEMTYDLSVPGPANFVANGFVVHNSHAACYGKVAYQTSYLKANYPVEYMAALMTADAGDTDSISILVAEATRMGIPVLSPHINESGTDFTVAGTDLDTIRFGLTTIKNFGEGISQAIIDERTKDGPFTTLSEFLSRVEKKSLNRKSLESLIKCGALDSFGSRSHLLAHIETLLTFHRDATAEASQDSLFGSMLDTTLTLTLPPNTHETTLIDKLTWEKELLGIYVSGHPLDSYVEKTAKAGITIANILADPKTGMNVILPVLLLESRIILTKKGDKMAFLKVEDTSSSIEAVIFPKLFVEQAQHLVAGKCLLLKAGVSSRNGEISLTIENLKPL